MAQIADDLEGQANNNDFEFPVDVNNPPLPIEGHLHELEQAVAPIWPSDSSSSMNNSQPLSLDSGGRQQQQAGRNNINPDGIREVIFRRETFSQLINSFFDYIQKVFATFTILFLYISVVNLELQESAVHYQLDQYRKDFSSEVLIVIFLISGSQTVRALNWRNRNSSRRFFMKANVYFWVIGVCYLNSMAMYSINGDSGDQNNTQMMGQGRYSNYTNATNYTLEGYVEVNSEAKEAIRENSGIKNAIKSSKTDSPYLFVMFLFCITLCWVVFLLLIAFIVFAFIVLLLVWCQPRMFMSVAPPSEFQDDDILVDGQLVSRNSRREYFRRLGLRGLKKIPFSKQIIGLNQSQQNQPAVDENVYKSSQLECVICLVPFKDNEQVCQLRCAPNHIFHKNCLREWIMTGKENCPVCRTRIVRERPENDPSVSSSQMSPQASEGRENQDDQQNQDEEMDPRFQQILAEQPPVYVQQVDEVQLERI